MAKQEDAGMTTRESMKSMKSMKKWEVIKENIRNEKPYKSKTKNSKEGSKI